MSDAVGTYDLPSFVVGNTWPGIPLYTVTKPAGAGDLDKVEIQFRQDSPKSPAIISSLTSPGEITIIPDATVWRFTVPARVLELPVGKFFQSVKLWDDSDPPKPYTYTVGTIEGVLPSTR
jgi:hypothetical protein